METNAKIFVSTLLGGFTAYLFASRLDTDSFAMKMFAMVLLTVAFQSLVLRLTGWRISADR
ncbi:hypothetical protein [Lacipirellula sp.]|uniref:hypothetical protein n=1 Tax=Lacipirellula sp. TaxID=2691419 RepID=UPI003D1524F0